MESLRCVSWNQVSFVKTESLNNSLGECNVVITSTTNSTFQHVEASFHENQADYIPHKKIGTRAVFTCNSQFLNCWRVGRDTVRLSTLMDGFGQLPTFGTSTACARFSVRKNLKQANFWRATQFKHTYNFSTLQKNIHTKYFVARTCLLYNDQTSVGIERISFFNSSIDRITHSHSSASIRSSTVSNCRPQS